MRYSSSILLALSLSLTASMAFAGKPASLSCKDALLKQATLAESWKSDDGFRKLNQEIKRMGQVHSYYDDKLQTRIYYTATGTPNSRGVVPKVDKHSNGIVVFFHGSGTANASGINFLGDMNRLANIDYSAMSFDMPFHADGPRRDQFRKADYFMNWLHEILQPARESGLPIYFAGHSFGPDVITEYLYRFPHDLAGAALLSPVAFNKTTKAWEKNETAYMTFDGEEVADNTLGGAWADQISDQFKWSKLNGKGDPTIENPNLRVVILTGDREEYFPGPTGGKNGLPIGPNTYNPTKDLRVIFQKASIVVEKGMGHMIFNYRDANGMSVVTRTLFSMLGIVGKTEGQLAQALAEKNNAKPAWVQLELMLSADRGFEAWLAATGQTGLARALIQSSNNVQAEKMMMTYRDAYRARVKATS